MPLSMGKTMICAINNGIFMDFCVPSFGTDLYAVSAKWQLHATLRRGGVHNPVFQINLESWSCQVSFAQTTHSSPWTLARQVECFRSAWFRCLLSISKISWQRHFWDVGSPMLMMRLRICHIFIYAHDAQEPITQLPHFADEMVGHTSGSGTFNCTFIHVYPEFPTGIVYDSFSCYPS